jgi:hypothetical protein
MASVSITKSNVTISLTPFEKVGGLLRDLDVKRSSVVTATAVEDGLKALRGIRAPGLGLPWVRAIGTWRGRGYRDWVSVGRGPAVVLELKDHKFARAVVGVADAGKVVQELS